RNVTGVQTCALPISLLIGITAAKTLAFAHHKPLIPVNHMAGHIYANQLVQPMEFPLLSLVVSGGHTELVYMPADGEFEVIGETRSEERRVGKDVVSK